MGDWEDRLNVLDAEESPGFETGHKSKLLSGLLDRIQQRRRAVLETKYTVVVQLPPADALKNDDAVMAFVLPTAELSLATVQDFREAAEKGGCRVRVFTGIRNSGIEHVKWELMRYGSTTTD